ncbi:MAG: DMT family transporter [Chloroflexi bacterium]|nr:DMT family transporter [Chloroflexota bacterium]
MAISTASIFVRFAQADGAPSLTIAALRLSFAALALLPLALTRCRAELVALSARELGVGLIGGAFLGAHFAMWISSLQYTSVASSVILVTLSPLFVAVGSAVFLRERLNRRTVIGMIVAILGGIVIAGGDINQISVSAPDPLLGNLLALGGAICIAPHFLIGRRLRRKMSLLAYISLVYGAAALVLLLAVAATGTPLTGFNPQSYLWVALLALLPQLVGHTSFNWSLGYLPATYATIPVLGEPIGSVILAFIFLGEGVTPLTLIGGVFTLGGIAMMMVSRTSGDK